MHKKHRPSTSLKDSAKSSSHNAPVLRNSGVGNNSSAPEMERPNDFQGLDDIIVTEITAAVQMMEASAQKDSVAAHPDSGAAHQDSVVEQDSLPPETQTHASQKHGINSDSGHMQTTRSESFLGSSPRAVSGTPRGHTDLSETRLGMASPLMRNKPFQAVDQPRYA
jgi:hypothetical protein